MLFGFDGFFWGAHPGLLTGCAKAGILKNRKGFKDTA